MPITDRGAGRFLSRVIRWLLLALPCFLLTSGLTTVWLKAGGALGLVLPISLVIHAALVGAGARALRLELRWAIVAWAVWPAWMLSLRFGVAPAWFLLAAFLLALVFGQAYLGRVPLFLSNASVRTALATRLRREPPGRLLDAGCGTGGALATVSQVCPDWRCEGVDLAWLPWLLAKLRFLGNRRVSIYRSDFARLSWSAYDAVYVFLSPLVMREVWEKARAEMHAGALLISNSFPVDGVPPDEQLDTGHPIQHTLYLWRLP